MVRKLYNSTVNLTDLEWFGGGGEGGGGEQTSKGSMCTLWLDHTRTSSALPLPESKCLCMRIVISRTDIDNFRKIDAHTITVIIIMTEHNLIFYLSIRYEFRNTVCLVL